MRLSFLTQTTAVRRFAAAAQASTSKVLDFTAGSIFLALAQAQTAIALWLQWLILLVLGQTRAATSNGPDLDTWMADFTVIRDPAIAATGVATLSRYSATQPALVVPGVQLKTADGTQIFTVVMDTTNSAWSNTAGAQPGYYVPAGTVSVMVPVQAVTPGTGGNIQAGTLTLLASGVSGIDYANNAVAFTSGIDAESDTALRARFPLFIDGLRSATPAAIEAAAYGVQQGVKLQLVQNAPTVGFYTLYVDDGSGASPDSFITAITSAVQAVTAEGVTPVVLRPTAVPAAIIASLQVASSAVRATVAGNVSAAIAAFVAGLPIGGTLSYLHLPSVVFAADPNVIGMASLSINGAQADLPAGVGGLIQATNISVA